jgi:transcription antitermination factor NusG
MENAQSLWFAVYTAPRHEKRVEQHLEQRGIEHFLPLYRKQSKWKDGSKVIVSLPLFPSYLFVRIPRDRRSRVLAIPSVVGFVSGLGRIPEALPEHEIESLRASLSFYKVEPHPNLILEPGHAATICTGPFAGRRGLVVRTKANMRVILTLDLIQRNISVECDASDLEASESSRDSRYLVA